MIETIQKWLEAIREYPNLQTAFGFLHYEHEQQHKLLSGNIKRLKKYQDKESKLKLNNKWERYWTNKHPKKNVNYIRHETDGDYNVDVRAFCTPDYVYPKFTGTNDQKMRKILIWVIENIRYVSDATNYKTDEYWAYAYQTMRHKEGDCEDGAILLWSIAMANNIPFWRVRLNAGDVKEPYGTKVGHAYVSYFRETDNEAVVLDWCYYPSYSPISQRLTHKQERDYYDIWWSTDTKHSYGNKKYMGTMPEENFVVA